MQVCDNLGDHMFGNLFVKFTSEDDAVKCRNGITGRLYGNKMVVPEFSPVSNFSEGKCRQYEDGTCQRGGHCNFMHLKVVPKELRKALFKQMYVMHPEYRENKKNERDRNRDRDRHDREKRDSRDKKNKNRSRSKDRNRDSKRKDKDGKRRRSRSGSEDNYDRKVFKMSSEERRAMIAGLSGNDVEEKPAQNGGSEHDGHVNGVERKSSSNGTSHPTATGDDHHTSA